MFARPLVIAIDVHVLHSDFALICRVNQMSKEEFDETSDLNGFFLLV